MNTDLLLSPDELLMLTRYTRAAEQLRELHLQGFVRARIGRDGSVILERAHYDAVCRGAQTSDKPRVRPPKLRGLAVAS